MVLISAYLRFSQSSLASWSVEAYWNCELPCFFTIFCTAVAVSLIALGVPCNLKNSVSWTGYGFDISPAEFMAAITVELRL